MKHGKKYVESAKALDKAKLYEPNEALGAVCQLAKAKFDETVEAHIRLGVDSRHADQQVRGAVVLPNGTGKSVRVLVFCKEDKYEAAKAAGKVAVISNSSPSKNLKNFFACSFSLSAVSVKKPEICS